MSHVVGESGSGPSPAYQCMALVPTTKPMRPVVSVPIATSKLWGHSRGEQCSYPVLMMWFGNQRPWSALYTLMSTLRDQLRKVNATLSLTLTLPPTSSVHNSLVRTFWGATEILIFESYKNQYMIIIRLL